MKLFVIFAVISAATFITCQSRETSSSLTSEETSEISKALSNAREEDSASSKRVLIVDTVNTLPTEEIEATTKRIKFSGTYEIIYKGYQGNGSERFELTADGVAVWTHKTRSGSSTKYGNWIASNTGISVSIKGNTGVLKEDFGLTGSTLISKEDKNRYLRKLY